jgi:hypothetical protein
LFVRTALVLACALTLAVSVPIPSAAAAAFDSAFAGESAFLTLAPGQSGTFTVFFQNTGAMTWVKGTDAQVDLAACRDDQVTCDAQDAVEATFDPGTWKSATRYAAQSQATVAPGGIGTFTYGVKVPLTAAAGIRRFNGDLVLAATGRKIHPEGYYHDLRVTGSSCGSAVGITASPAFAEVQVGVTSSMSFTVTCSDGSKAVGATVNAAIRPGADAAGNAPLDLTATTDASGVASFTWMRSNPGREVVNASVFATQGVQTSATVRWVVPSRVITCAPGEATSLPGGQSRNFTITVRDPTTGQPRASQAIDIASAAYIATGATATINGVSAVDRTAGSTVTTMTTDADGVIRFVVTGRAATVLPRAFWDENSSDTLDVTEFRGDCGSTSFEG